MFKTIGKIIGPWTPKKVKPNPSLTRFIDEVHRNALAFGFEIGKGKDAAPVIDLSPDNPFGGKNWREVLKGAK